MKDGRVLVITHGEKGKGVNPGLTEKGFRQINTLRLLLPEFPVTVVAGEGLRYYDSYCAANVSHEDRLVINPIAGTPDSLEVIDGKKIVILGDGTHVPLDEYTDGANQESALEFIADLPNGIVLVFGGRPLMMALGVEDAKSASIYRILVLDGKISEILEICCRIVG